MAALGVLIADDNRLFLEAARGRLERRACASSALPLPRLRRCDGQKNSGRR